MFQNSSFALSETVIQLRDGGIAEPSARPGVTDLGAWSVTTFHADNDRALHADVWECHPSGHEVLGVLSGAIDVHLRDHDDGAHPAATLTTGRAFIVPPGQWHRLTVREPAFLLAITPRQDTRHERVAARNTPGGSTHRTESR